ncbi:MAG TPA: 3-oxoacyl-ACP reductase FabG [Steroidobacteraceae bacterium]|nr:3-oxoacyl-ACP reductase FabG [Steroidobacteraceae bacterium]
MFDNDVVLVTGGSRGIGRAIAVGMAAAGARVIGTSTSEAGAAELTATFTANGLNGRGAVLDVASDASIDALLADLEASASMPSILVNNAAITRDGLLLRMKPDDWNQVIATNLTAVYRLSKGVLRRMMKERRGRIINITSIVGVTGNPGQVNYAAAKAGILGFTKSLAQEVASRGITVNAVAPGFIDTDMTKALSEEQRAALTGRIPMERLGTAADVASAVLFLASPQAGYITGETLHVNGGLYMP